MQFPIHTDCKPSLTLAVLAWIALSSTAALAGPNTNGSLILHYDAAIGSAEDGVDYCPLLELDVCQGAVTSVEST